jgi:hypothetical protein
VIHCFYGKTEKTVVDFDICELFLGQQIKSEMATHQAITACATVLDVVALLPAGNVTYERRFITNLNDGWVELDHRLFPTDFGAPAKRNVLMRVERDMHLVLAELLRTRNINSMTTQGETMFKTVVINFIPRPV